MPPTPTPEANTGTHNRVDHKKSSKSGSTSRKRIPGTVYIVAVVLTLTHPHNTMQSVVAGQAPITLEWKKCLGKNKTSKE